MNVECDNCVICFVTLDRVLLNDKTIEGGIEDEALLRRIALAVKRQRYH